MNCDALLGWIDRNQVFYICLVGGLITAALILAIMPLLRVDAELRREHDWCWGVLIVAILAAGRWPSIFFPRELNPDEGLLLAGARALIRDPVFWRSVDGGTAGPLEFFALWPAGALFGWQSYVPARFTSLCLLAVSLVLAHQCIALIFGRKVARIAGLAAVCLESLTNAADLLSYSSELLPMAMVAAAAYASIRRWAHQGGVIWNGLGGVLLGAIPFAKLQVVPIAACLGLGWLCAEVFSEKRDTLRRTVWLLAGAFLPTFLFACQLTITREWEHFLIFYVFGNIGYSKQGFPLDQIMAHTLYAVKKQNSLLDLWLAGNIFWIGLMIRRRCFANHGAFRAAHLAGLGAILLAMFCIFFPGRAALHYWQIAILPCTFLLGVMTGSLLSTSSPSWKARDRLLVAFCAFLLVGTLLIQRARTPNCYMGFRGYFREYPHNALISRIKTHVRAGDSIAIWGWSNNVYVETGLHLATRHIVFTGSIESGPYSEYYRACFLADLVKTEPTFFLDSTGPGSTVYQNPEFAHDQNFPELAALIGANYVLVDNVFGARLYRKRDSDGH